MFPGNNRPDNQKLISIDWWCQLKKGDKAALEAIYSCYVDDMYRYGMAIKADSCFVQDCIQEVFLSVWKYRTTLKETDNIQLYLFKCLSNKIHREGANGSRIHADTVERFDYVQVIESPEQSWIRDQGNEIMQKKLAGAIEGLPPRQKEAVQLLFFEGLPYEAVAAIMNLHIKSVYTLAWKAIGNLRKIMVTFLVLLGLLRIM